MILLKLLLSLCIGKALKKFYLSWITEIILYNKNFSTVPSLIDSHSFYQIGNSVETNVKSIRGMLEEEPLRMKNTKFYEIDSAKQLNGIMNKKPTLLNFQKMNYLNLQNINKFEERKEFENKR